MVMEIIPRSIRMYQTKSGDRPFGKWIKSLKDLRGRRAIEARIDRLAEGNFGDHKSIGDGVTEIRIHYGPGYRIYIALQGDSVLVLLVGGDKGTQNDDIIRAKTYWNDYKNRILPNIS